MVDPRKHPFCLGYVVGLPHPQIERLLSSPKYPGEFVVSYEKSPLESPPIVCLYNDASAKWCTKTTLSYACPFCSTSSMMNVHEFENKAPEDKEDLGWYGHRTVRCKDGLDHTFGLYLAW